MDKEIAGGFESAAHQADVYISIEPSESGVPLRIRLEGGRGHEQGKDAKLEIDGVTITPNATALIRTGSQGNLEGELTSSDTLGTCTIGIYGHETPVRFAWDEVSEEGEWSSDPEYFSPGSQSVETLTLRHHRGGEDDDAWAPLDGHSVRFYVEYVEYLDEEGTLCVLTNTPTNPSDLSEWASFPDQAFVTDSDGAVSATLTVADKPELESLTLVAYDFTVWDEPVEVTRTLAVRDAESEDGRLGHPGTEGSGETVTVDMIGREPDGEGAYRDVPQGSENEPGVLLVVDDDATDKTVIRVTDPGTEKGVLTLTWENPANNKKLKLTGPDGGTHVSGEVEIDCATAAWPMDFEAETVGREWNYEDKATLTLEHDGSEQVDTLTLVVVSVDFLNSQNTIMNPASHALNVSNHVTDDDDLPASSAFDDTCEDMDNFRLQINGVSLAGPVQVKLDVLGSGASFVYEIDQRIAKKCRGQFLRLVADSFDDDVAGNQTILVKLGDVLRIGFPADSPVSFNEIQVGRPVSESNNSPTTQLQHDIRELTVHVVVFEKMDGSGPAATLQQVQSDLNTIDERLAQSSIRIKDKTNIDMGGGGQGIPLTDDYAVLKDGCRMTIAVTISTLTDDESAVLLKQDTDANSIDIFYVDTFYFEVLPFPARRMSARAYYEDRMASEMPRNFVIADTGSGDYGDLTLAHEIMHILLNQDHRNTAPDEDPDTALFYPPGNQNKAVRNGKRIGPYPDSTTAGVGAADTRDIRNACESLP